MTDIQEIPLERIHIKDNVREDVGDVSELAASIAGPAGLLNPLIVQQNGDDDFYLTAGHRRFAALQLNKAATATCIVRNDDDSDRLAIQLVENLQRVDLNVIEEAQGYQHLIDIGNGQQDVARLVSRHQSHVSKRLLLLALPAKVQRMVSRGEVPVEWAQDLARIEDHDQIEYLLDVGLTEWRIKRAIEEQENQAKLAAAYAAGIKAGLPMADEDEVRLLATTGEYFESVAKAKKHTFGEDERVVARMGFNGKVAFAVYEPKSTKGRDSSNPEVSAKAIERHTRKVERETRSRIVAAMVPVIAKPKKTETLAFAAKALLEVNLYQYAKEVCELLDLEVITNEVPLTEWDAEKGKSVPTGKVRHERQYAETVTEWAKTGDVQYHQALLALVVAIGQSRTHVDGGIGAEVEAWLQANDIPDAKTVQLEVAKEFNEADAEAAAKKAEKDAKRAAKEAEAAAAEAPEPDAE